MNGQNLNAFEESKDEGLSNIDPDQEEEEDSDEYDIQIPTYDRH